MSFKQVLIKRSLFVAVLMATTLTSVQLVRAYTTSDFAGTISSLGYDAGATNVLLGSFSGPTPATDTLMHNGATYVIAAGNALTAFASGEKYFDTNNDSGFDTGEAVVTSANTTLDTSDTVVTGSASTLTAIGTSEAVGTAIFLDADADGSYDSGERLVRQVVSGSAATMTSGQTVDLWNPANADGEVGVYFMRSMSAEGFNFQTPYAVLQYTRSGGSEQGAYVHNTSVLRAGDIGFKLFDSGDGMCIADGDTNGAFSFGEDFWWDAAGTCASFTAGVDLYITDDGNDGVTAATSIKVSDASTSNMPLVASLGYSDADMDGHYDCARGGFCEQLLALSGSKTYTDGQDVDPTTTGILLLHCALGLSDSATNVSTCPSRMQDADPALTNFVFMDSATQSDAFVSYAFVDTDLDGAYDAEEDIIESTTIGSGVGNMRFFPSGRAFMDYGTDNDYWDAGEPILVSADTALTAGSLGGGGTDTVIVSSSSGFLDAFAATNKYFDHNSSGAYADGDDVVDDLDSSTYYNADDLLTIQLTNDASDYPAGNDDLDNLYVYQRVGGSCAGSGTDTLLGSIASSPFLATNITITAAAFTAATNYCVYADLLGSADGGEYFTLSIYQNDATYSSGTGPTNADEDFSGGYIPVQSAIATVLTPTSVVASTSTSYTVSFTTGQSLISGDMISVLFPSGYDVTGASIVCTDDGSASAGTSGISSQHVQRTLSTSIASGSAVVCTVSSVVNPSSAGDYSAFGMFTYREAAVGTVTTEYDSTFSAVTITPATSGGTNNQPSGSEAPTVSITTPVAGATVAGPVNITWTETGSAPAFANIVYYQNDHRYAVALGVRNTGSYTWTPPTGLLGESIDLRVELTDLASVVTYSSAAITVGAADGSTNEETEDPACAAYDLTTPDLSDRLYKSNLFPTVYYLDSDNLLRPFFNAPIFFSWSLAFQDIQTVQHDWLSNYTLGAPMVPLPGSTLIKSPDDPRVWVMEPNDLNPALPILHWIASEEVAIAYFGSGWATRIIDVAPSIIVMAPKGGDLTDPTNPPCYIGLYN